MPSREHGAPEERNDLRRRDARHGAQRRRDSGRAPRGGDEHPCGSGDGLSRHHLAPYRSPTVRAIAPGGARRDGGGVRARRGEHHSGGRQCQQGEHRFRLSTIDVRRPRIVGRRRRSPDAPGRRTQGTARLRRHLWRMCVALFIAAGSFFLGPVRRIPEPLRIPALRLIPLVVLLTMVYWLWRHRRKRTCAASLALSHLRQSDAHFSGPLRGPPASLNTR